MCVGDWLLEWANDQIATRGFLLKHATPIILTKHTHAATARSTTIKLKTNAQIHVIFCAVY